MEESAKESSKAMSIESIYNEREKRKESSSSKVHAPLRDDPTKHKQKATDGSMSSLVINECASVVKE